MYELGALFGTAAASFLQTRLLSGLILWLLRRRSSRENRLLAAHITAWQSIVLLWFCGPLGHVSDITMYTLTVAQIVWLLVDYSRPVKRFARRGQIHEEPDSAANSKDIQILQAPAPNRIAGGIAAIIAFALMYYYAQALPVPALATCIVIAATCIIGLLLWITGASKSRLVVGAVAIQGGEATWWLAYILHYPSAWAITVTETVFVVGLMIFVVWLGSRWTFIVFCLYQICTLAINVINVTAGSNATITKYSVMNIGIAVVVASLLLTFWVRERASKLGTLAGDP